MDLALLTMLTYQIYIILMDLALLTVLAEQIYTIYNYKCMLTSEKALRMHVGAGEDEAA
jgi:hypothetical protein